jgi:hypothetical protein
MIETAPNNNLKILNYDDAKLYCFAATINGKTGWRLPTIDELKEIYQTTKQYKTYYWSSTPSEKDGYQQIMFFYDKGEVVPDRKENNCFVLPVRDLKDD